VAAVKHMVITMDIETMLLISIFQKAYPVGSALTAERFVRQFEVQIDRTGHVLQFLGLAVKVKSSPIGFKPTPRLVEIIADRLERRTLESRNAVARVDRDFLALLWQTVPCDPIREERGEIEKKQVEAISVMKQDQEYEDAENQQDDEDEYVEEDDPTDDNAGQARYYFCLRVLAVLGLLKKCADGYVPTRVIHNLILEACLRQYSQ
jgi:hypothetical protein